MQLKDQAAIVTGGASGLGAATARRLAAQGAKVAVCDLNGKLAESVAAEIGGVAVICDVADAASAEAPSLTSQATATPPISAATVSASFWLRSHTATLAPSAASLRAVAAPSPDAPLSIDRGEVTDKGSINQRAVLENRNALIEEIYSPAPPVQVITL